MYLLLAQLSSLPSATFNIDAAVALALLSFAATVAATQYASRGGPFR